MSAAAKMRPTEVNIKMGTKTYSYRLSKEMADSIKRILENIVKNYDTDEETVSMDEAFPEMKDPKIRIATMFRGLRFKNNLTQKELAERLGLDQSDVSKIEKGKRPIGKALAHRIEKEFGDDYRLFL